MSVHKGLRVHGSGGCMVRGCMVEPPPTATAAGGTHPTGKHSCFLDFYKGVQ